LLIITNNRHIMYMSMIMILIISIIV
jgi:hypothetical protein